MALLQEIVVIEDIGGRPIGHDRALVDDDGPLAQIDDHVEVVGGDDLGVMKTGQQFDQGPARHHGRGGRADAPSRPQGDAREQDHPAPRR